MCLTTPGLQLHHHTQAGIEDLRKSTTQMRSETDTLKTAAARGSNRLLAQYTTPVVPTTTAAKAVSTQTQRRMLYRAFG
jgi:hypothetical protein